MSPVLVSLLAFAAMAAGTWWGMHLRSALPDHHLSNESKDAVRLGMAFIASLTALVLGLVLAAARNYFAEQDDAVSHSTAGVLTLDRTLADYGPEAQDCRHQLRRLVELQLHRIWGEGSESLPTEASAGTAAIEQLDAGLRRLAPQSDDQRELKSRALSLGASLQEARWLQLESEAGSIPTPFLVILVFWLTVLFWSFGLFAPSNATVWAVYLVCALSGAAAIYLILELEHPYHGLIKVSSAPAHYTLSHLGE